MVDASIGREKVTRTFAAMPTSVWLLEGVRWITAGGALGSSRMIPAAGVSGSVPMSARMFVVACWIRASGSPRSSALRARPQFQWLVPVATTSAPLAAAYLTMWTVAEPGTYTRPASASSWPVAGDDASVLSAGGARPLSTRASHSQPTIDVPTLVELPGAWFSSPV
jgi:hypothetical protein